MVGFGGFVATPVTPMPTASPVVLKHVTVVLAEVVVHPVSVTPAAVSDKPVPLPVAAVPSTNVVEFVTDAIVVEAAMFVPLMLIPGINPVVLLHVTVVVPLVVQFESTMAAVWLFDPPVNLTSPTARKPVVVQEFMLPESPLTVEAFAKSS